MTPEERAAQERIKRIADQQAALESRVKQMQDTLTELVINGSEKWLKNPAALEAAYAGFSKSELTNVVTQWAKDLLSAEQSNADYFRAVAEGEEIKDYAAISKEAKNLVLDRFGLDNKGKLTKSGFFDSVLTDKTTLRKVVDQSWQLKSSGAGVDEYKASIKQLMQGAPGSKGFIERHFDTFAYDTYQDNDAVIQEFYAQRLELEAALYLGGEIVGTRPLCHELNGNVLLRDEIAALASRKFAGKTSPYNPFINRGGYRCRHHWHWLTQKQAVRRDSTLFINTKGKLERKSV